MLRRMRLPEQRRHESSMPILLGGGVERALVGVEERREVPAQLIGHHVFGELLLDDLLVVLLDLDDAVDVAVDVAFEHVLDAHEVSFLERF